MSIELSKAQKFSSKGIILMKTANLYGYNKHIGIKNQVNMIDASYGNIIMGLVLDLDREVTKSLGY